MTRRAGSLALSEREVSHVAVFQALGEGREVFVALEGGGRVLVEDAETVAAKRDGALREGSLERARALNAALIGLEAHQGLARVRSFPRVLQVETTSFCNARCIMCRHSYAANEGARHASVELFEKLGGALPYVEGVVLHGLGEPLLNPNLGGILSFLSARRILVSTNTNLSVVPCDLLERFASSFHSLKVSCDGASARVFESIRRGLSFETFSENLMAVRDVLPQTRLVLAVTVMRQNAGELPRLVELAAEARFDAVEFTEMAPDPFVGNFVDAPGRCARSVAVGLQEAVAVGEALGVRTHVPRRYLCDEMPAEKDAACARSFAADGFYRELGERYRDSASAWEGPLAANAVLGDLLDAPGMSGVCDWTVEKAYVDLGGGVHPCCSAFQQMVEPFGNLFDEPFETIWNNGRYRSLRSAFYSARSPRVCAGCGMASSGSLGLLRGSLRAGAVGAGKAGGRMGGRVCLSAARYEKAVGYEGGTVRG